MPKVRGPFEVKLSPLASSEVAKDAGVGRMSLEKQFHGALEGESRGEMLGVRSADQKSGGYVAMERFEGALDGRRGAFHLQHGSFMDAGKPEQSIRVVPGSGAGELAGLRGSMVVELGAKGEHVYVFEYELIEPSS